MRGTVKSAVRSAVRSKARRARLIGAGAAAIIALCFSAIAWAQAGNPAAGADATLTVAGDVTRPLTLTPADLKAMPRTTVTVSEDGRQIQYEGVLVGDVLSRAGAPLGKDLSGKALASYVLASARDG